MGLNSWFFREEKPEGSDAWKFKGAKLGRGGGGWNTGENRNGSLEPLGSEFEGDWEL